MWVHAHAVFIYAHVFNRVRAFMTNEASYLASYLSFSLNYNTTVLVTLLFLYKALATSNWWKMKLRRKWNQQA